MTRLFSKNNKHRLLLLIIFLVGLAFFGTLLLLDHRIVGSDDYVFPVQTAPYPNVIDWVMYRYQSWSGRIFSEGVVYVFSPAWFGFWQIVTLAMYALFSGVLFAYYRLFSKNPSPNKDYFMLVAALALPYLMNHSVIADTVLWMTGSMVYFWTCSLGLVGLYPVVYYVIKQRRPHWVLTILGIVCAVIATGSAEQVGAVLLGVTVVFLIYSAINTRNKPRKVPWYILFFIVAIGAIFLVSVLAPGNAARLHLEAGTWLPDFYVTPILERAEYGYRWLLEAFINHAGFLLITIWLSMAALFVKKVRKDWLDYLFIFILTIGALFALARGDSTIVYWTTFYATWKPDIPSLLSSLNLLPWGVVMASTVVAPLFLYRKKPIGYFLSILLLAAIASMALLILSPTMYVSLWRCFYVPSVVLMIIAFILLDSVFDEYRQYRFIVIGLILSIALSQFIFQASRLVDFV